MLPTRWETMLAWQLHHELAVIIIADLPRSAGLLRFPLKQRQTGEQILLVWEHEKLHQYTFVMITLNSADSGVVFRLF